MIDQRRQKINDLKASIKENQDKVTDYISEILKEEDEEKKKELRLKIGEAKVAMSSLKKELELVRMNKNSSSSFQWLPHIGLNRRQARAFRRMNKK